MTAPNLPLAPPRDFENITFREVMAAVRTGEDGGPAPPPTGTGASPVVALPIADGVDVTVMTAQPSGATDYGWAQPWFDTTAFNQMRVIADVETAGHTTAEVFADQTSSDGGTYTEPATGGAEVAVPISAAGKVKSDWKALDPAAIGDRIWRARGRGGNGTASPVVKKVHFQFRRATLPRPPRGTEDPLPEDATWGAIVFDANANATSMREAYGDGDDVNDFHDQVAANNLTTGATLLLPKYRTAGIGGARPCVEWDGTNVAMSAATNPTGADWTYYFIIENLDGGDGARIWGAGLFDSFQYAIYADNDTVYAANNNLFGSPSLFVEDSGGTAWGMGDVHIYRWVKRTGAASHGIWINGVHKGSAGAAPQSNNGGATDFMNAMTGLGITGRIGRVVAYNKAHISPTNTGGEASGLTAPEIALQSFWGTP